MARSYDIKIDAKKENVDIEKLVDRLSVSHPDVLNVNVEVDGEQLPFVMKKKGSGYQEAQNIRKKGLTGLITEKLLSGEGVGHSIKSSISERTKATFTGMKEKFDIMNIAKMMTGGSNLAPALVGRMLGRSQEDIEHFAGKKKVRKGKGKDETGGTAKRVRNKNPLITTIGPGRLLPLRKDDSIADITAKLYNLLQKSHERKIEEQDLQKQISSSSKKSNELTHKALMKAIKTMRNNRGVQPGKNGPEDDSNGEGLSFWEMAGMGLGGIGLAKFALNRLGGKLFNRLAKSPAERFRLGRKGISVPKGMNINKSQSLKDDLSRRQLKKLEKEGIKWNEKTQRFHGTNKEGKMGRMVSAQDVAKKIGKNIPGETAEKITKSATKEAIKKGLIKRLGTTIIKKIPLIGLGAGLIFGVQRALEGDFTGAGAEVASGAAATVPAVGTLASMGIDTALVARDVYNDTYGTPENPKPFDTDLKNNPELVNERKNEIIGELKKLVETKEENKTATKIDNKSEIPKPESDTSKQFKKDSEDFAKRNTQPKIKVKGSGVKQDIGVTDQGKALQVSTPPVMDQKLQKGVSENKDMKLSSIVNPPGISTTLAASTSNQSTNIVGKNNISVSNLKVRNPDPSIKKSFNDSAVIV